MHSIGTVSSESIPYLTPIMFVCTLRQKTTKNVSVQIVYGYRNTEGKPRLKIACHMGNAPEGMALEALLGVTELEMRG